MLAYTIAWISLCDVQMRITVYVIYVSGLSLKSGLLPTPTL